MKTAKSLCLKVIYVLMAIAALVLGSGAPAAFSGG